MLEEGSRLYSNTKKVCVFESVFRQSDPLRSVNVALVLELQMQMTACSIFPNTPLLERF